MAALAVTKAHLQYALSLMAKPVPYPQIFFEDASLFLVFFPLLDKKTTFALVKKTKNADVEPSFFGRTVVKFAKQDFVTAQDAFVPIITKEFDEDTKRALQHFATHAFLNLAAWYICPLFAANNYFCPYMPQQWITKFLAEKKELNPSALETYFQDIIAFIAQAEEGRWARPYQNIAGQLGRRGAESLLMLVGMFLDAHDPLKAGIPMPTASPSSTAPAPSSPFAEFIEGLNLDDFSGKSKK